MIKDFKKEVELIKSETTEAIDFVRNVYPENMRFALTKNDFNSICLYIKTGSFDIMILNYGYLFTLSLLDYFVRIEYYEKCKEIIDCINNLNEVFADYKIPTSL